MKIQILFLMLIVCDVNKIYSMDFFKKIITFEEEELEEQVRKARFELFDLKDKEEEQITKNKLKIFKAIEKIENGLKNKKKWQQGEVEVLFDTLFSVRAPYQTIQDHIDCCTENAFIEENDFFLGID